MTWTKEEHEAAKAGKSLDALDISEMLAEIERAWGEIERLHDAVCHAQSDEIDKLNVRLAHAHDAANKLYQAAQVVSVVWDDASVSAEATSAAIEALAAAIDPAEAEACTKETTRRDGLEAEIASISAVLTAVGFPQQDGEPLTETFRRAWEYSVSVAHKAQEHVERLTGELVAVRAQPAAHAHILRAARAWYEAASLGCPRDCPVDEKERRIGRAEQELSDAVRDAHHAHRDAMFAKLTAINGRGPNVSAVEGGPILVPPPERRPDSPPSSDPLAGLPAEEQARILASAEKAQARRANPWQTTRQAHAPSCPYRRDALNVCLCADELYKGTIAREVAAYHARLPVNSIGTCSRCGYYGPGPGHDCPALTPAEQAEIIAGAPGQIGSGQTPIGRPQPADARLEARALDAKEAYFASLSVFREGQPDRAWQAVVRAVDASRPALTEVPGIVFDVLEKARVFIQPLTDTPHDEAVHAAESGCCRTCYAETMLAEIECAETECRLVENRCHILTFAEQAPKDPNIALWDAINRYTQACGGDPNTRVYGNIERQRAVVDVHRAVDVARGAPPAGSVGGIDTLKLFINLLEIDARARCLCEDASIDHTTTPPSATVEVDQLEALDAALNAVDPSEEYDPAMRDALLAQLDAALSRGAAPAARSTASTELLVRQAAAILSEDEHAEEDTRAGIEQLNQEIKP
jgi:hypothetical protein